MAKSGQQDRLRVLLRSYLRRRRPIVRRLSFHMHGVDLQVTTDREDTALALTGMLGHAAIRRASRRGALSCHVYTESSDVPSPLNRFEGAEPVMSWETTGYFTWKTLYLIDFYPWGTAAIDPHHREAVIVLNGAETPPPLIFSNQVFFQTLEVLLRTAGLYPVHASAVAQGRRAVLFPAESGAGKTTLSLAMVEAGYRFLGDDKPMIAVRAGRPVVLAFPEPIHAYVDELRYFNHLPHRPHPDFPPDFPLKMSFRVEEYWPGSILSSAIPRALVFPEPRRETPPSDTLIEPVSRADGLRRLIELNWPLGLSWGFDGFLDLMRDLVERTPCYRIRLGASLKGIPERINRLIE